MFFSEIKKDNDLLCKLAITKHIYYRRLDSYYHYNDSSCPDKQKIQKAFLDYYFADNSKPIKIGIKKEK